MNDKGVGVKIAVDNAEAKPRLSEIAAAIDQLGQKQGQMAQSSVQAGGLVNSTSRSIKSGIESISEQLDRARGQLLGFLGVQQGIAGAQEVARQVGEYRDLEARIGLVVGRGQQLAGAMDDVQGVALRTNSALEETGNLFARIAKVGKDAGLSTQDASAQSLRLTETINQAIQIGGASAEASKAAITQLIQGLQGGVLRGDEFNSVMEQAPRLAQAMADGLGVNTGELRKMAEAGQLTSETVISALRKQTDVVKGEFAQVPVTVGRAMENLRTSFQRYLADTDQANGATATAAKSIGLLAENIGTVSNALLHAGMTFGAWKALNMARSWLEVKLAVEADTAATVGNTTAKGANTAATRGGATAARDGAAAAGAHAAATRESAAAQTAHAAASQAATAAMRAQRVALEAERAAVPSNAKAWGEMGAALGSATAKKEAAGAAAATTTSKLGLLTGAVGGLVRGFGPLLALDIALNFKNYGTWIGEAAAKLMGYKDRSAELARQEQVNARIAAEAAEMRREMARKTQEAIEKQFELSKAARAASAEFDKLTKDGKTAAEAVSEITKGFDLTKTGGIKDFASTLDKLLADGKIGIGEFQAAWSAALDGKDLIQFETLARTAFMGSQREGERLAQMMDGLLRDAVKRTGFEWEVLQGKSGAAARSAVNDTEVIIAGLDKLSAAGIDTGRVLDESLTNAINAADSNDALEAIRNQIERVRDVLGTRAADGFLEQANDRAHALNDKLEKLTPGINSVREAMGQLGVTSDESLGKMAKSSKEAYDVLVASGKGSTRELQDAFKAAAESAIKAADGVAPEWVKVEAAARNYRLEVDKAGDSHLVLSEKAKNAAGDVAGAFERMGLKTNQQLKDAAKQASTDFTAIENSGQGSAEAVQEAFKRYANAAIAANGGVASEFLRDEAKVRGIAITYDASGKAVARTAGEMGNAMAGAFRQGDEAAQRHIGWLERVAKRNAEVKSAIKMDGEGFAVDEAGRRVVGAESEAQMNQRIAKLFGDGAIGMKEAIDAANIKIKLDEADQYGVANLPGNGEYYANLRREYARLEALVIASGKSGNGAAVGRPAQADKANAPKSSGTSSGGGSGISTGSGNGSGGGNQYVTYLTVDGTQRRADFKDAKSQSNVDDFLRQAVDAQRRAA